MTVPNPQTPPSRTLTVSDNVLDSKTLFENSKEVLISHNGDTYKLRITLNDKLILTK